MLEEEKTLQENRIAELSKFHEILKTSEIEKLNFEKRQIEDSYKSQIEKLTKQCEYKDNIQKMHNDRKNQDDRMTKEISELKGKLNEMRKQLLESRKDNSNENINMTVKNDIDTEAIKHEYERKITDLNEKLNESNREIIVVKQELENKNVENAKLTKNIEELEKHLKDAQNHNNELNNQISQMRIIEEQKETQPQINELNSRQITQNPTIPLPITTQPSVNQNTPSADLVSGAGPGPETSKSGEENVGDEARGDNNGEVEDIRREDLSAESGSTALVEKGMKNEQKEGQYESTHEILEEPEDSEDQKQQNAGNEGNKTETGFDELPLEEEIKENPIQQPQNIPAHISTHPIAPTIQPVIPVAPIVQQPVKLESDAGQSPVLDGDEFFDNLGNMPDNQSFGMQPPQPVRPIVPISTNITAPMPTVQAQPVHTNTNIATQNANKKKMDVVPDDLF